MDTLPAPTKPAPAPAAQPKFCTNWGQGVVCTDHPPDPANCPAPRFHIAPDGSCQPVRPELCQVTIEYLATGPHDPLPVLVPTSPGCDAAGMELAVAVALSRLLAAPR